MVEGEGEGEQGEERKLRAGPTSDTRKRMTSYNG